MLHRCQTVEAGLRDEVDLCCDRSGCELVRQMQDADLTVKHRFTTTWQHHGTSWKRAFWAWQQYPFWSQKRMDPWPMETCGRSEVRISLSRSINEAAVFRQCVDAVFLLPSHKKSHSFQAVVHQSKHASSRQKGRLEELRVSGIKTLPSIATNLRMPSARTMRTTPLASLLLMMFATLTWSRAAQKIIWTTL